MSYIQTISGRKIDLVSAVPSEFIITDIAHALSLVNRFGGHTPAPYSVAQHSVLCAKIFQGSWKERLTMLLHDAHEAYTGDMPKHVKIYLGEKYKELEDLVQSKIATKFGAIYPLPQYLKDIDSRMLETEFRDIMMQKFEGCPVYGIPFDMKIEPWRWEYARAKFMETFNYLHMKAYYDEEQ